jgi:hypothetical protein
VPGRDGRGGTENQVLTTIVTHQSHGQYTLQGWVLHQVVSQRECTRDAEWKLLRMRVIDFARGAEASFLAEKVGGDAAQITAPIELQGDEEQAKSPLGVLSPAARLLA